MMERIERLWRRVLMLVSRGRITIANDATATQTVQVRLNQITVLDDVPRLAEYGFQSVPPDGADAVVLFLGGNTSDGIVIATGHQTYRLRNLAPGDVALSDSRGQSVLIGAAGIRVDGASLPIEIHASAGLTVVGPVTFTGTVTANGHRIDETHKHAGVTTGGGLTGVVT